MSGGEFDIEGLYVPWLMALGLLALVLNWGLRRVLALAGFYRWVWHPALFDMALYLLLLYGLHRVTGFLF